MTASSPPPQDLTTTQALQRMLELLRGIHAVTDVTPDLLQRTMGKEVHRNDNGSFGFGQRLPGDWAFSAEWYLQRPHDVAQMDLGFDPIPDTQAGPVATCEPDYAAFTASLEGMGFKRYPAYGEHGRWKYDAFDRQGLRVEVYPMSAAPSKDDPNAPGTRCVQRVRVR